MHNKVLDRITEFAKKELVAAHGHCAVSENSEGYCGDAKLNESVHLDCCASGFNLSIKIECKAES